MTHLDHTYSAAAVQRTAILDLLRARGEDGASVAEMVDAGGMWWRKRVDELRRAGYLISEDRGRCYLEREPDVESDRGDRLRGEIEGSPVWGWEDSTVALDTEPLVLFPSGSSHYEMGDAA